MGSLFLHLLSMNDLEIASNLLPAFCAVLTTEQYTNTADWTIKHKLCLRNAFLAALGLDLPFWCPREDLLQFSSACMATMSFQHPFTNTCLCYVPRNCKRVQSCQWWRMKCCAVSLVAFNWPFLKVYHVGLVTVHDRGHSSLCSYFHGHIDIYVDKHTEQHMISNSV